MKGKKILSCALAVMLSLGTLTVLPAKLGSDLDIAVTADAASDFVISTDEDGYKYIDGYKGSGGNVTIPSDISYINSYAFEGQTNITSITAKGDLYAWEGAFKGCTKLKKVVVNGDAYINREAFFYCASLETFEVKGSIDELIGADAFAECSSLKSFKVKGNEFNYGIGEEAFYNCLNLTSVDIKDTCTEIYSHAFTNCVSLSSLTIPAKTKFVSKNGINNVGFTLGYLTKDDDEKAELRLADGSTAIYIFYYTFNIANDTYWDTDYYGLYGNFERFVPRKITLTVTKGSPAESFAKKNGIAYKYAAAATADKLAEPDNFRASAKTKTTITLKWDKVKGADAYTVYMYNSKTGKYEKYKTVKGNSCVVDDLTKNTKYKFIVAALDKVSGKYVTGEKSDAIAVTTSKK